MRTPFLALLLAVSCAAFSLPEGRADDVFTVTVKKQEEKKKSRWYLTDWLETRDKMRMMDLWLALHSPSPYEFYLSGDYRFGSGSQGSFTGWNGTFGAFATIFGLEGQYESVGSPRWHGLFNLRIFGLHDQGTNITLHAGVRGAQHANGESLRNALAGVRMSIYINRFFGVQGLYRRYFESTPGAAGTLPGGSRLEGGAFIDFSFLRVFGTYFTEDTPFSRTGFYAGTQLYF